MSIEGTVVILNENGEAIPFQQTELKCFSHYAPDILRSGNNCRPNLDIDETGKFSGIIPHSAATLFFFTQDDKYAAIVDITPNEPLTDLVVELRPRYAITGRILSGYSGKLFADSQVHLESSRTSDVGTTFGREYSCYIIFHSVRARTDSEGFFTIDGVIPGTQYHLYGNASIVTVENKTIYGYFGVTLEMPILEPEQYQEPLSLGDLSFFMVNGIAVHPACCNCCRLCNSSCEMH
jgi:hypothetical protein